MGTYKITNSGSTTIRKKSLLCSGVILGAILIFTILTILGQPTGDPEDVNVLPFIIPVIIVALGFGVFIGFKRQKMLLESYSLTITNNLISREQANTPKVSIYFNEIKEINKHPGGNIIIKGNTRSDIIIILPQIEKYDMLLRNLNEIHAVNINDKEPFNTRYSGILIILTLASMGFVYTMENKVAVGFSGLFLAATQIWSISQVAKSKNIDRKTKQLIGWSVLVLCSVIVTVTLKLVR